MIAKEIRAGKLSDAFILQRWDSLKTSLNRDLSLLAEYNVSSGDITATDTLRNNFENVGGDELYMGDMMLANVARGAKARELYEMMDTLKDKVELRWPGAERAGKLIRFALDGSLSQLAADELYRRAKNTAKTLDLWGVSQMAAYGIDATYITNFKAKVQELDDKIDDFNDAVAIRKGKTTERIIAYNFLYHAMIKLGASGQSYWKNRNATMFEEYVINETPVAPVTEREVTLNDENVTAVNLPVDSADTNILSVILEGADNVMFWFANLITDPIPPEVITVPPGPEVNHLSGDANYDTANRNLFCKKAGDAAGMVRIKFTKVV